MRYNYWFDDSILIPILIINYSFYWPWLAIYMIEPPSPHTLQIIVNHCWYTWSVPLCIPIMLVCTLTKITLLEVFLDIIGVSKTVDRHGTECLLCYLVPPDFWQPFLLNEGLIFQKGAENGNDGHWEAKSNHSSLLEYSNSMSLSVAPSFSGVFTQFFLHFWLVYIPSMVCPNMFEGLSNHKNGFLGAV